MEENASYDSNELDIHSSEEEEKIFVKITIPGAHYMNPKFNPNLSNVYSEGNTPPHNSKNNCIIPSPSLSEHNGRPSVVIEEPTNCCSCSIM
jgi:hypothetical protein